MEACRLQVDVLLEASRLGIQDGPDAGQSVAHVHVPRPDLNRILFATTASSLSEVHILPIPAQTVDSTL